MKDITARDLKESLTLLFAQTVANEEGGLKVNWRRGPRLWGSLWPLVGADHYQDIDEGGAMASHQGYLKTTPAPRYRLYLRAGIHLPEQIAFLWKLRLTEKHLSVVNTPVFIQNNRFLRMTVVEAPHA